MGQYDGQVTIGLQVSQGQMLEHLDIAGLTISTPPSKKEEKS